MLESLRTYRDNPQFFSLHWTKRIYSNKYFNLIFLNVMKKIISIFLIAIFFSFGFDFPIEAKSKKKSKAKTSQTVSFSPAGHTYRLPIDGGSLTLNFYSNGTGNMVVNSFYTGKSASVPLEWGWENGQIKVYAPNYGGTSYYKISNNGKTLSNSKETYTLVR